MWGPLMAQSRGVRPGTEPGPKKYSFRRGFGAASPPGAAGTRMPAAPDGGPEGARSAAGVERGEPGADERRDIRRGHDPVEVEVAGERAALQARDPEVHEAGDIR